MTTSTNEKRKYKRFNAKRGLEVVLIRSDNAKSELKGLPVDIGRGGAYVKTEKPVDSNITYFILFSFAEINYTLRMECRILAARKDNNGNSCAVAFLRDLSDDETHKVCSTQAHSTSHDLVKSDFQVVNNEIDYARRSRVAIFVAIISCLSTWVIGAVALALTMGFDTSIWLVVATSLPTFLCFVGICSNAMCINFINQRKAYLTVLTYYFRSETIPPGYLGWSHISVNQYSCKNRIRQGRCKKEPPYCYQQMFIPKEGSGSWGNIMTLSGKVIESIGKIFGLVYAFLFLVSSVLLVVVILKNVNSYIASIVGIISFLIILYLIKITFSLSFGTRSIETYCNQWKDVIHFCGPLLPES